MPKNESSEKFHIIPFISDYGFKVTFADENSLFAKKALELLAELDSPIEKIDMLRNEFLGMTVEARAGVYDVICRDEQKLELGKFNIRRKDYAKIKTEKEELIYTMKYGHEIDLRKAINVPPFWQKEWIDEAIAKLDQRNMTPEEYAMMEIGIFQVNLIHHQQQKLLAAAKAKAEARGEARAKAEAEAEKLRLKTDAVKRMVLLGMTSENIALVLQEMPEFIRATMAEVKKESGPAMPEA